ncbi:MerR family transcriptional regulator [bacterium]|jgi:MerR family mercuric resistance operon transcriptional regulator|nr:MerR family transcriptional regulator [bacterium]
MKHSGTYTIGSLANDAGVGIQTVRFYERQGLLKQPARRGSGYRQYSSEDAKQIRFIKRAQELGFTLKEVKGLLELQAISKSACSDVKVRADQKTVEIQEKIQDLKRMQRSLAEISSCCARGKTTRGVCSILDCFEGNC